MSKWYEDSACNEGIVISSRVRLARNLKKYPFPETMNETQTKQMIDEVKDAIVNERTPISKDFEFIEVNYLPALKKKELMEKHIISPVLLSKNKNCAVLVKNDETVSIMLNEEDHIRINGISRRKH